MTRLADDAYLTQDDLALAICQRLNTLIGTPRTVLEPSAGEGSFVRAAYSVWPGCSVHSVEPRPVAANKIAKGHLNIETFEEFAKKVEGAVMPARLGLYDLVLGNPPYKRAEEHVMLARSMGRHVAFLLRMSFLSSQGRVQRLWDAQPGLRWLIPLAQRPTFMRSGGTDNSEYAVYVWERGFSGWATITRHLWV